MRKDEGAKFLLLRDMFVAMMALENRLAEVADFIDNADVLREAADALQRVRAHYWPVYAALLRQDRVAQAGRGRVMREDEVRKWALLLKKSVDEVRAAYLSGEPVEHNAMPHLLNRADALVWHLEQREKTDEPAREGGA